MVQTVPPMTDDEIRKIAVDAVRAANFSWSARIQSHAQGLLSKASDLQAQAEVLKKIAHYLLDVAEKVEAQPEEFPQSARSIEIDMVDHLMDIWGEADSMYPDKVSTKSDDVGKTDTSAVERPAPRSRKDLDDEFTKLRHHYLTTTQGISRFEHDIMVKAIHKDSIPVVANDILSAVDNLIVAFVKHRTDYAYATGMDANIDTYLMDLRQHRDTFYTKHIKRN